MINIKGLDKAEVLAALYNSSRPLGMGYLHFDPTPMTKDQAQEFLDGTGETSEPIQPNWRKDQHFDYLKGRVMKVDLSGDELHDGLYDRDNGTGAAYSALRPLLEARQEKETG